jgi:hypothetical protein
VCRRVEPDHVRGIIVAGVVEEQQLHPTRATGKDRKIHATADRRRTEGKAVAR